VWAGMPAQVPALADDSTLGDVDYRDRVEALTGISLRVCPVCREGQMIAIVVDLEAGPMPTIIDTS